MKEKRLPIFAGFIALVVALVVSFAFPTMKSVGGVSSPDSYNSTTTDSTFAHATLSRVACTGDCVFGSIVVNQVGTAGWVRVWSATSTATSSYSLNPSATYGKQLAQITGASDVGGTYVYDISAPYGVVIETSTAFDGQYSVTYKK